MKVRKDSICQPSPLQSEQTDWICWTMPGPSGRIVTFIPEPLQDRHGCIAPGLPPCLSTRTIQQHHYATAYRLRAAVSWLGPNTYYYAL